MRKLISVLAVLTVVLTCSVFSFSAECGGSGCSCVSNCSACSGVSGASHLSVTGGICPTCGGGGQVIYAAQAVSGGCPYCYSRSGCNCSATNYASPVAPVYVRPAVAQSPVAKTVSVSDSGGGGGVSIVDVGGGKMSPITGDNFEAVSLIGLMFLGVALFATRKLVK